MNDRLFAGWQNEFGPVDSKLRPVARMLDVFAFQLVLALLFWIDEAASAGEFMVVFGFFKGGDDVVVFLVFKNDKIQPRLHDLTHAPSSGRRFE